MSKIDENLGLDGFDKVLEHRIRLAICVLLRRSDSISFARFKETLEQTDGNLGAQLRKLEEAGYIKADKQFQNRKPVTWYTLTAQGNAAVQKHVAAMRQLLGDGNLTL